MRRQYDEDLFRESTMTFGEHLEELRRCLFKAILGLVAGFLIGLLIGDKVVDYIQRPLRDALTNYYQVQSEDNVQGKLEELRKAGYIFPAKDDDLRKLIAERNMIFEQVYVNPAELLHLVRQAEAGPSKEIPAPPERPPSEWGSSKLVPMFFWHPLEQDARIRAKSLSAHEAFTIYIKAALLVGAVLASPWVFYQLWSFVAAGLYPHEKRYVHVFLPISLGLFLAGAGTAFFFVFKPVLDFLFYFNSALGIDPDPRISEWVGFVLVLPLGFGIAFQLPLAMLFLERIGIVSVQTYLARWRIAVLSIFVLSMILTPSDPYSMLLMACPLTVLYFGGILLCRFMPRVSSGFDEGEA